MDAQPQNRTESVKPKPESSPPVVGVVPGLQTTDQHLADILSLPANIVRPRVAVQRIRVSQGVMQSMVLQRVPPVYPPDAKRARIQGTVVLAATIDKDEKVKNLEVLSGPVPLVDAAITSVQQ
jgi:periplasmic protein TonB